MIYLEFKDGKSNKFWKAEVDGGDLVVTWGRIGSTGQTKRTSCGWEAAAKASADKQATKKLQKGYVNADTASAEGPPAARASAPRGGSAIMRALTAKDPERDALEAAVAADPDDYDARGRPSPTTSRPSTVRRRR